MIRFRGLSRQITLSMIYVSLIAALVLIVGSYIFYALLVAFFPELAENDSLIPTGPDLLAIAIMVFFALVAAIIAALRLAGRILAPLNSVAASARRITDGDLSARAVAGDRSLGETAHLADDFNEMASRLQKMAADVTAWNATIAHELRTPLTILRGRIQGLADGVFQPSPALYQTLLTQVEGLSRLVDDLKVVTLVDSGRFDLRFRLVHLAGEVGRAVDVMRPAIEAAGFRVDVEPQEVRVWCDDARIRQALLALIDNALRYAKPGRIGIIMTKTASTVTIRVEDEGQGLPPDFVSQAFEPFSRAEFSRSRAKGGSGLGLTMVRAIAIAHSGSVTYRAAASDGAAFELTLPIGPRDRVNTAAEPQKNVP
ncbi:ATP-binding protein [Labrys neptuniae]